MTKANVHFKKDYVRQLDTTESDIFFIVKEI